MNSQKRTPYMLILSLLVAGCFSISPAAKAADTSSESSEEIRQILSQVKTEAITQEQDSDQLAGWTRTIGMSWQSHTTRLSAINKGPRQQGRRASYQA
jgi:hypothetical protein